MLRLVNLAKRYGQTLALDGFNLEVAPGERVVIMGPSGCGKSTAIRCINRLTEPDEGEIYFQGRSVLDMKGTKSSSDMRKRSALSSSTSTHSPAERFSENVMFGLVMRGWTAARLGSRPSAALAKVGLSTISISDRGAQRRAAAAGRNRPGLGPRPGPDAVG